MRAAATFVLGALASAALAAPPYPGPPKLPPPMPAPPPPGPPGGIGLNMTPQYAYMSPFDFQSFNLALNQEWIELDLFNYALAKFSDAEFDAAGINAEGRELLRFMGQQEIGHATLLSNILQGQGALPCKYQYPFHTVRDFIDFSVKLTRFGESGVYGFLEHLDSRAAAELLLQSISTEARQQMVFRQFEGLFPMPVWFETGVPQAWAWTLLSPYLVECPAHNPMINFTIFPTLNIQNNPNASALSTSTKIGVANGPAISHNRSTPLTAPGREVVLIWDKPGKNVSYNSSYVTQTMAGAPKFVAWVNQLNLTYTPLYDVTATGGKTKQPGGHVFNATSAPLVNQTVFIAVTDSDTFYTPFNLSGINEHVVAGPALYTAG